MENIKNINRKKIVDKMKQTKKKNAGKRESKKNLNVITVIDYAFLISLALCIIFGIQTNTAFMWPFAITLLITVVCMMTILINAIYVKIFKKIKKGKRKSEKYM